MRRQSLDLIRKKLQDYIKEHTGKSYSYYERDEYNPRAHERYEEAHYTLKAYQEILYDLNGGKQWCWKNGKWWPEVVFEKAEDNDG